jgi:orotate phosphoribosyltransferase
VGRRVGAPAPAPLARTGAARRRGTRGAPLTAVDDLGRRLLETAFLEGDFTLRSGKRSSWYLDKYRFETDPSILRELGERLGAAVVAAEPDAVRLAAPALGAVALAASGAMASGLPFIIVRGETKGYGTGNRIEGPYEPGELVCLVEDVVTSGGALCEAVEAVREAGLVVRHAVCVVDREEGGADALARVGVRLDSLYRASALLSAWERVANPHG